MQNLPEGWEIKKLGDIATFTNGFAFKSSLFKDEGKPILRIANIKENGISFKNLVYFNDEDYSQDLSNYKVFPGDLVIAMSGATTGKLTINNTDKTFYLNQRVGKIGFDNEITKQYIYSFLKTKIEYNLNRSSGSAIPNLSTQQIKNTEIPLPPLETQKQIAAKLDEVLGDIDQSIQLIQQNIAHIDEMSKSVLNQVFEEKWEIKKLGDIVNFSQGLQVPIKEQKYDGNYRFLRIIDFTQGNQEPRFIEKYDERAFVKETDISMVRYGASTGFICTGKKGIIANNLFKITATIDSLNKKYLYFYFLSDFFKNYLFLNVYGAAMPAIKFSTISELDIPLPPLSKQQEIVDYLDNIFQTNEQLKNQYQQKLANLQELKKSVLNSAFEGKLV
ncbi:restriction endonuclease subunit S [Candidatus Absconditicoccus praedator]|uniref:restriction endonuclease subunit S n=1 Tax=Candidatus Absconditicoccus praedator TaxID=2735562 RepID=UPI001E4B813C|nr:restriction endonuclease subunit S [Candidatus Absconditicoccus praedator]UFX82622.1 restriction endonuclease subunit S [Candidatus Absconditicoccus praedator]